LSQSCFTFWYAAIPGVVRNLPEVQASADEAKKGSKSSVLSRIYSVRRVTPHYSLDEHLRFESLIRSRISNISLAISSAVEVLILAIMVGILKALKSDASVENNTKAFNVLLAFCGGVLCSFPRQLLYAIVHLINVHQCFVLSLGLSLKSADRASFYLQDLLSQRLDSNKQYLLYGSVFV
jgi:hypothetical protein